MKTSISITAAIVAVASSLAIVPSAMAQQKPNIVFMMVDNLGWGEIGVYGGASCGGRRRPDSTPLLRRACGS